MKIFITGGAGFVGAHVAGTLLDRGDEVVVLDDFSDLVYSAEFKKKRLKHVIGEHDKLTFIEGSLNDPVLLNRIFKNTKFDAVIHLAAHPNPKVSLSRAYEYSMVNELGTVSLLEAMKKADVKRLIFAGSSSVYNDVQTPFDEAASDLRPQAPYGVSKLAAEHYCRIWHELYGFDVTVLRFFTVYGEWGRPDMAPWIFAESILNDKTIELSKDRQRDFTYIGDITRGVVKAVDTALSGFEIINLGRGKPVELQYFVRCLAQAAGKKVNIVDREAPAGEMRITFAKVEKAKKLLQWEPEVSVEEGTQRLMIWLKEWHGSILKG